MYLFRHAGLDPASRRRPDESWEPSQVLDSGFRRNDNFHENCTLIKQTQRCFEDFYFRSFEGIKILVATSLAKVFVLRQKSNHGRKWETLSLRGP